MRSASAAPALEHSTAHNAGVDLHVVRCGSGEPVLCLHGFPECWMSWRSVVEALGQSHLAATMDNRGFNASSRPEGVAAYHLDEIAKDILATAKHLGASPSQPLTLVGHDWGGIAAWWFAAKHPDWVKRLVVLNAPHPALFQQALSTNPVQRERSGYLARMTDPGAEARIAALGVEGFWAMIFAEQVAKNQISPEDRATYLAAWQQAGAITAMLNWYRASPFVMPAQLEPESKASQAFDWVRVNCPVRVIWGQQDTLLGQDLLNGLEAYAPNLQIHTLKNAGHGLLHDHSSEVAALLKQFLAEN